MSTTTLREGLPPLPRLMQRLQIDHRGYPIPWFVAWYDGKPDFRVVDHEKMERAVKQQRCFICGEQLGRYRSFVGGPMMMLQMISAEPPSHHDCATFAVMTCPFLILPKAKRRSANLPADLRPTVGEDHDIFVEENPGISGVWTCTRYQVSPSGRTFHFGDVSRLEFFSEGRKATADEIKQALHRARDRIISTQQLEIKPP